MRPVVEALPLKSCLALHVLRSERRVLEAAVPPVVSAHTKPLDVIRSVPAVVVPRERAPFEPLIDSAARVDVASPATVVVAKYKLPPAFLMVHCAMPAPAERES